MAVTLPLKLDGSTDEATPTESNIVTRAGKGAKVNALEFDNSMISLREAVNALNDDKASQTSLEAVQTDALLKLQVTPESHFMALAAANRDKFAGSGFIHFGKQYSSATGVINQGMWAYSANSDYANTLLLGRSSSSQTGTSKSDFPTVNVNGFELFISGTAHNAAYVQYQNMLLLPPAPAVSTMLERQDLVFLEVWHEKIADKDIVYPYGNTQSLLATDPSTGSTTVAGSFTGYGSYSLFGNWQSSGALIGKGLVWSTMSEANKKTFVSEPKNNVYLAADGTLVQVRYRIRVVEGLGAEWANVKDTLSSTLLYYDSSNYVTPKGSLSSISSDFKAGVTYPLFYANGRTEVSDNEIGSFKTQDNYTTQTNVAFKGLCFALPIALVSRRNQGAFHPVWNPNGTTWAIWNEGATGGAWYKNPLALTSIGGCFDFYNSSTNISGSAAVPSKGTIADHSQVGRPDGKYHDAIYEGDVLDLRSSAHKQDLQRTITREFNKLVAGEARGWEGGQRITSTVFTGVTTAIWDNGFGYSVSLSPATALAGGTPVLVVDGGGSFWKGKMNTAGIVQSLNGQDWSAFDRSTSTNFTIYELSSELIQSKELLHCDIIGDPANYPSEWLTNGVFGTPLLVGENGEDYIPTGSAFTFKLSRKTSSVLLALKTTDNGATWTDVTTTYASLFNSTSNSITATPDEDGVYLLFYKVEASPFETTNNAEVLELGDVWAGNAFLPEYGANIINHLLNKVAVNAYDFTSQPVSQVAIELSKMSTSSKEGKRIKHQNSLNLSSAGTVAVKVLPYLTRENGKLYLQCLFKEMVYDSGLDSTNDFSSQAESYAGWTAGTFYEVTDGRFQGYWYCEQSLSVALSALTWYLGVDGNIYYGDAGNGVYLRRWDGNGWGDNNKFDVVDGISTGSDDNGNTYLCGQARVELNCYISDAA